MPSEQHSEDHSDAGTDDTGELHGAVRQVWQVASSAMADQSLSEQAREAVLKSIIKSAPTVGNSPAGIRDLAEAYALLERELVPNAGVVKNST
jgi:hypothetical protein